MKIKQGSLKEMMAISFPMVISYGCDTIMTFTDRLFLSKLGSEKMNAAMGGGLTAMILVTFFIGLTGYATAIVAQYFGADRKNLCALTLSQIVIISIIVYPVILFCIPVAHSLFIFMDIAAEQRIPQEIYFNIIIHAMAIGLFRNCFASFFSGIGRTKIVMAASVITMLLNAACNYILIYGKFGFPAMEIRGAGYGTVIASFGGLAVLVLAYFRKSNMAEYNIKKSFHSDWHIIKLLLFFGYPAGLELFLNFTAFTAIILTFHSHSLEAATAVTIAFNWDLVSFVPLIGLQTGITSLVGRYMGRKDPDTAHQAVVSAMKMGVTYSAVMLILFAVFPEFLVWFFEPAAIDSAWLRAKPLAVFMVRLASVYVLVDSVFLVLSGALRGAGDTFWAMFISVTLHWLIAAIVVLFLKIFDISPEITWIALVIMFLVFSLLFYLRYKSGVWKRIEVIDRFKN